MEELVRAFDRNYRRRCLKRALRAFAGPDARLPHAFETDALLAAAQAHLDSKRAQRAPGYRELLEETAASVSVCRGAAEASTWIDRLPAAHARSALWRALFLDMRDGSFERVRTSLQQALSTVEKEKELRTQILLTLGRAARYTQDAYLAESCYLRVLDSGVRAYRPLAQQYLAVLRSIQGRSDEAISLNREAHKAAVERGDASASAQLDSDLAVFHLTTGRLREARKVLESVIAHHVEIFDLGAAGNAYNNLAMVFEKEGNLERAKEAYLQSIRCESVMGRKRSLSTTYRNLGGTLLQLDEPEAGLAAFETAIRLAVEVGNDENELRSLTEALVALRESGARRGFAPVLIGQATSLLERSTGLSSSSLQKYARVTSRLLLDSDAASRGRPPKSLATDAGRRALSQLSAPDPSMDVETRLGTAIGDGLPGGPPPSADHLCRFLLLYAGDRFQLKDYAAEFPQSEGRIKHQLRELCDRGIIRRSGTRKSARYTLSFHL